MAHDCRARIVPDNPFAFPPSLEVNAGGKAMTGAIAEVKWISLLFVFAVAACGGQVNGNHFELQHVDANWSNGEMNVTLNQSLTLSSEARKALVHGVPLTVQMELIIRNTGDQTRVKRNVRNYEIRYLPLSDHYQLTLPGASKVRTFPRLRHVLADLSTVRLSFSTGVLPAGEYELLARIRLDKRKMPPPMRLPALFSSEWHHDSDWSAWVLAINPQA